MHPTSSEQELRIILIVFKLHQELWLLCLMAFLVFAPLVAYFDVGSSICASDGWWHAWLSYSVVQNCALFWLICFRLLTPRLRWVVKVNDLLQEANGHLQQQVSRVFKSMQFAWERVGGCTNHWLICFRLVLEVYGMSLICSCFLRSIFSVVGLCVSEV
jgi:hypothetical protein